MNATTSPDAPPTLFDDLAPQKIFSLAGQVVMITGAAAVPTKPFSTKYGRLPASTHTTSPGATPMSCPLAAVVASGMS